MHSFDRRHIDRSVVTVLGAATVGAILWISMLSRVRKRALPPPSGVSESDLELYRQAADDARAYMDMRNRHFSTFLVISGLLLAGLFDVSSLASKHIFLSSAGLAVTVLYWLLDYRMAQYIRGSTSLVRYYEAKFERPALKLTPGRRLLPATLVSNLLFTLTLILWLTLIIFHHEIFK
jgi:hypothetical protein